MTFPPQNTVSPTANEEKHATPACDIEQNTTVDHDQRNKKTSIYAGLGWLDRLLVVWILLAIVVGILLGNFVDGIGPALQKGKFVDVSVPIGVQLISR